MNAKEEIKEYKLTGSIERVTFHNPENGFCVLKVLVKNKRDLITVIGNLSQVLVGEEIEAFGQWVYDSERGYQFQARLIKVSIPTSLDGIKKYLASGLIKGIGKHFAGVLVDKFGVEVLNILDNEPEKVRGLPGIGEKRTSQIIEAWSEQKIIREIMLYLHSHGIGTAKAVRIYKVYGEKTIAKLQENPYCLALDVWGIGFKTADKLAQSIGIAQDSVIRAEAGIRHILGEYSTEGHCAIKPSELIEKCISMLEIKQETVEAALLNELKSGNVIEEETAQDNIIFLAPLFYAEQGVASSLSRLMNTPLNMKLSYEEIVECIWRGGLNIKLSETQTDAVVMAINSKVSIITGGPGVGKTTIIRSILSVLKEKRLKYILCAPTGRAAKRLSESSGVAAKTIHRLLEYKPRQKAKYDQDFPLETDFVIIDEVSMVDITLMNSTLKAIPSHAQVLFVGDIDQLPSVGPGAVLADMINSYSLPTVMLTEIYRQAATSKIITNAHKINKGYMPYYENHKSDDFFFIDLEDNEAIIARLLSIVSDRLPKLYNINPFTDIQILSPMNRGILGVRNLNLVLQDKLNSNKEISLTFMGATYRLGDKVIQMVNNYDKEVFNGDIGFITEIDLEDEKLIINFEGKDVKYDKTELDEVELAYAVSIHKSQGSEYPIVIVLISTSHYTLLERNLLYTAVTRGKKMVILIGQKKAVFMAIKRTSSLKRLTNLSARITKALAKN